MTSSLGLSVLHSSPGDPTIRSTAHALCPQVDVGITRVQKLPRSLDLRATNDLQQNRNTHSALYHQYPSLRGLLSLSLQSQPSCISPTQIQSFYNHGDFMHDQLPFPCNDARCEVASITRIHLYCSLVLGLRQKFQIVDLVC